MQIVPWYATPANADAWHQVRAPGGYEWWYFDAEDSTTDTQIVAIFLEGFVFHPGYLRRYAEYLRKPTVVAPPVASDFPCAYFVIYRGGKILGQFMTQYASSDFEATAERPQVRIGPNRMISQGGAIELKLLGTPWKLTWQGPKKGEVDSLRASFNFKSVLQHAPSERIFFSKNLSGAEHHWVLANPLCEVTGTIQLGNEAVEFKGRGYHDHNYGTGPIGPGLDKWVWGRAIFENEVRAFHFARPRDKALADEVHLVHGSAAAGLVDLTPPETRVDWSRRNATGLAYPNQLEFGDELRLSQPRLIDSSPFYMRLIYSAAAGMLRGTAFCEVAYPHRLRWPILGRMIEMSIDHRDRS